MQPQGISRAEQLTIIGHSQEKCLGGGGGGGGRGDELAYSGTTLLQGHLYCDGLANLVQVLGGGGGGGGGGW